MEFGNILKTLICDHILKYKKNIKNEKDPIIDIPKEYIDINNITIELRNYQTLSSIHILSDDINSLLLYWEPGLGKTIASAFILDKLEKIYPKWIIFIFVQSRLIKDPWIKTLKSFYFFKFIIFIPYNVLKPEEIEIKFKKINKQDRVFIIVDEVHDFVKKFISDDNSKKFVSTRIDILGLIKKNVHKPFNKLLLLSGTPFHNSTREITIIMHLLRPRNIKIDDRLFDGGIIKNKDALMKCLWGISSVQRLTDINIFKNSKENDFFPKKDICIKNIYMSKYQTEEYMKALKYENSNQARGFKSFTKRVSIFAHIIYKTTSDGKYEEDVKKELNKFKQFVSTIHFTDQEIQKYKNKEFYEIDAAIYKSLDCKPLKSSNNTTIEFEKSIENLYMYSCKNMVAINLILNSPGKCLLVQPFVSFAGVATFVPYLELFKITFIEYTLNTANERTELVEEFNNLKNINGELIKACIISSAGYEGITFTNIRTIIILDIPWTGFDQIIGRGIRLNSHKDLDLNDRTVDINILIAHTYNGTYSTDEKLLNSLKDKEKTKIDIYNMFKETSIDDVYNNSIYTINENETVFPLLNQPYDENINKSIILKLEMTEIYYTTDPNFNIYKKGYIDNKNNVYNNGRKIGSILIIDNKRIWKIIDNIPVFLIV